MIRFFQHNQELFENIVEAVFSDSPPTGSGSTSAEITAGQKASYEEITMCTFKCSQIWALFNDKLDAGDLAGAEVLLSGSSEFARNMKRFCLYSAAGIHGAVPKTEPRRAAFNAALLKYETPQRKVRGRVLLFSSRLGSSLLCLSLRPLCRRCALTQPSYLLPCFCLCPCCVHSVGGGSRLPPPHRPPRPCATSCRAADARAGSWRIPATL